MKKRSCIFFSFVSFIFLQSVALLSFSQQVIQYPIIIQGSVRDKVLKTIVPYPSIVLFQNGKMITGEAGDSSGNFKLNLKESDITDTLFDIKVTRIGYFPNKLSKINFRELLSSKIFSIEIVKDTFSYHNMAPPDYLPPIYIHKKDSFK